MKKYNAKKLIPGYKLGCEGCKGKSFIGVPSKYLNQTILVEYNGQQKVITSGSIPVMVETFQDKYGRNQTYTLSYFEWT